MNIDPRIESPEVSANGGASDAQAPVSGAGLERELEEVVDGEPVDDADESIEDAAGAYAEAAAEVAAAADPEAAAEVQSEAVADPEAAAEVQPEAVADPEAGARADAEADIEALIAKAAKADEYLGLAQRTQADFENYRKRAAREAGAARERGAVKLARELLPAVDNLERALAHANASADTEDDAASFVAGIRHVHTDVLGALRRAGIEAYSPEGEAFDPHYHEAVAQASVDGAPAGTVVEVFQRGYRLGETVLRPARVVVAG